MSSRCDERSGSKDATQSPAAVFPRMKPVQVSSTRLQDDARSADTRATLSRPSAAAMRAMAASSYAYSSVMVTDSGSRSEGT